MRVIKFVVPFMLALFISAAFAGEGKGIHGELAAAPDKSAENVVGVLTVKGHAKPGADAPAPKTYTLVAKGEVATQVKALIGKNVDITGEGTEASYTVTTVAEHKKKVK